MNFKSSVKPKQNKYKTKHTQAHNGQIAENWKPGEILSSIQREKDGYFQESTIRMLADFSIGMKKSNRQCIEEIGDTNYWKNVK